MKIKVFSAKYEEELEEKVNDFLSNNAIDPIEINFNIESHVGHLPVIHCFIVYEAYEDKGAVHYEATS